MLALTEPFIFFSVPQQALVDNFFKNFPKQIQHTNGTETFYIGVIFFAGLLRIVTFAFFHADGK